MTRTDRTDEFFVWFDYTSDALTEIGAFFRRAGKHHRADGQRHPE